MKWIAKTDFYRTVELTDLEIIDACEGASKTAPHDNHIHRGAIFELGTSKSESELQTGKDPQRKLIAQLRYAGRIGDATDKDVVARVVTDVKADKAREENAAKTNKQTIGSDAVEKLLKLIESLSAAKAAPAK